MTPIEYDILTAARPLLDWLPALFAAAFAAGAAGDMARRDLQRRWTRRASRGLAVARPGFERSASWWVERHAARPARHRARGAWLDPAGRVRAVRAAVVRRARRVVVGVAALVDELTAPARQVGAA